MHHDLEYRAYILHDMNLMYVSEKQIFLNSQWRHRQADSLIKDTL